jgi:hypothetical protein
MTADDLETTAIFEELWEARMVRVDAQLQRIDSAAFFLGRQLAHHDITRDDVNRRLSALCAHRPIDDDAWVPVDMAETVARDALNRRLGS